MRTIDDVVDCDLQGQAPDFLKMDVQGYELEVLKGADPNLAVDTSDSGRGESIGYLRRRPSAGRVCLVAVRSRLGRIRYLRLDPLSTTEPSGSRT